MGRLRQLGNCDSSRFWKQLDECCRDEKYLGREAAIDGLKASVRNVAEQAGHISGLVSKYLPQYTLHNETHSLNVLAIMGALVPDEVMDQLTPLECALCIMAAYTHDLGMALSQEEHDKIHDETQDGPEHRRFTTYRDGFGEELRQMGRWRGKCGQEAGIRVSLIEGHILASYIRETHTNESIGRIEQWLDKIAENTKSQNPFVYDSCDFRHNLALIDTSHGNSANWLRSQLTRGRKEDGFHWLVGQGEWVNFAFPGLLLRLADIMDFDASRAPRILFKHIGIENEKSILEWEKHLSITGWDLNVSKDRAWASYSARCEHPVYEKAIRDFKLDIDGEIKAAQQESDFQQRHLTEKGRCLRLHLPTEIELDVRPENDTNNNPVYIYEDIEFRLDQDEIQQLLLGEPLWGDPQLCIREMLQNALDAVQMRDLRLQLRKKGRALAEPVDPLADAEELCVVLTWGHDENSGQDYILVKDNGTGMTRDVITKYFTQIGKSFYRSPDFERERRAMKEVELSATPISTFGIGILSCFMIGDRLEVRTRQGGANNDDRRAYDITVSGPGSLFWLKEGTLSDQGTEVKVFLKPEYSIEHDSENFLDSLREHFGYKEYSFSSKGEKKKVIDPPFIAASHVVWPIYPINIRIPEDNFVIRIDDHFHVDQLAPMDKTKLIEKAEEWGCPDTYVGTPEWGIWDWSDRITGSRIRLWFPRNYQPEDGPNLPVDSPAAELCRQDELSALVEPQLAGQQSRTIICVNGVHLSGYPSLIDTLDVAHRVGCRFWIDLRGNAAPSLTADRREVLVSDIDGQWRNEVHEVFVRMRDEIKRDIEASPSNIVKNLLSGFQWHESLRIKAFYEPVLDFDLLRACKPSWEQQFLERHSMLWPCIRLLQGAWLDRPRIRSYVEHATENDQARARDFTLTSYLAEHLELDPEVFSAVELAPQLGGYHGVGHISEVLRLYNCLPQATALNLEYAQDHALALIITLGLGLYVSLDAQESTAIEDAQILGGHISNALRSDSVYDREGLPFRECLYSHILQEAFWPDLSSSFPLFDCLSLRGRIGNAMLIGPGLVEFELESDDYTVHPTDLKGKRPEKVASFGYDVIFPMTAIPLGKLRTQCPNWRTDRQYRCITISPFLVPSEREVWSRYSKKLSELLRVDNILALLPRIGFWSKPFSEWTNEDWEICGISALWDMKTSRILWAEGAHCVDEMRSIGKPIGEFTKECGEGD